MQLTKEIAHTRLAHQFGILLAVKVSDIFRYKKNGRISKLDKLELKLKFCKLQVCRYNNGQDVTEFQNEISSQSWMDSVLKCICDYKYAHFAYYSSVSSWCRSDENSSGVLSTRVNYAAHHLAVLPLISAHW